MATLLLSDLHLPTEPSPLREGFLEFLGGPARGARAVYILGDLFEFWVGDDHGLHDYSPEAKALRKLVNSGVTVFFQHGNRDFLVGKRFSRKTGVRLLPDPVVVNLEGRRVLLSHGDQYCTEDISYQRLRRITRNRLAQWLFLSLPVTQRDRIVGGVRGRSDRQKNRKSEEIMDVSDSAITAALHQHHVAHIIHGHTHRPADHQLTVDDQPGSRIVLADWRPRRMEYLRIDRSNISRIRL